MPFYYLHKQGTGHPTDEKDFKYLLSTKTNYGPGKEWVQIPIEDGNFCPHGITGTIQWDPDDDIIDIQNKHSKQIFTQFKKVYDKPNDITIWENVKD
jgi:hypothetical protein